MENRCSNDQWPSSKSQSNPKHQWPIGYWDLFIDWDLGLGHSNFDPPSRQTGSAKKNPSAVAGKGSCCFEAQVGARAKTVEGRFCSPNFRHRAERLEPRARPTRDRHWKNYFFLVVFFVVFLADFLAAFFAVAIFFEFNWLVNKFTTVKIETSLN